MKNYVFLFFALILFSISFNVQAHDFYQVNNDGDTIYYKIISSTSPYRVAVTFKGDYYNSFEEYSGDIIIPSKITNSGIEYNVTVIDEEAFRSCVGLTSITLPYTITKINYNAFRSCTSLLSITYFASTPPITNVNVFGFVPSQAVINVPCGSISSYRASSLGGLFNNYTDTNMCRIISANISDIRTEQFTINLFSDSSNITEKGYQWRKVDNVFFNTIKDTSSRMQCTISGLTPNSKFIVQAYVKINDEFYFTKLDTLTTFFRNLIELPFNEDFEGSIEYLNHFYSQGSQSYYHGLSVIDTNGIRPTCSAHSGTKMVYYQSYNLFANNYAGYITPKMNIIPNSQVNVWIYRNYNTYSSIYEGLRIYVNYVNSLDGATDIGFISNNRNATPTISADGWYNYIVNIPSIHVGEKYIIIKAESNYGNNIYFDDLSVTSSIPTVETLPITNLSSNSVILNGSFHQNSNPVTSKGFQYKLSTNTNWTTQPENSNTTPFLFQLSGLITNSTYNVRAYAFTQNDSLYGETIDFTTLAQGNSLFEVSICQGETYAENGFNENTSGTYTRQLQTPSGSDSTIILTLNVIQPSVTNIIAETCSNEPYDLNGFYADSTGTYIRNLQTVNGCDSIIELDITVYPSKITNITDTIELGRVYNINGFYSQYENTYFRRKTTECGCDSLVNLSLSVTQPITIIDGDTIYYKIIDTVAHYVEVTYKGNKYNNIYSNNYSGEINIPSTITYNGINYTVTRIGNYAFFNSINVTSINIPLTVTYIGANAFLGCGITNITLPQSITFIGNSSFYNCSQLAKIKCLATIPPTLGTTSFNTSVPIYVPCESLPLYHSAQSWSNFTNLHGFMDTTYINASICSGQTYTENGFNISTAGTYTRQLQTIAGCDSIVNLILNVNQPPITNLTDTICQGETYTQNGFNVSTPGMHFLNFPNINGCDSTVILMLTVRPAITTEITASICQGETYTLNGFNVDSTGIYTQHFQSNNVCDSIVILNLTVIQPTITGITASICQGETYNLNGFANLYATGIYTQNLISINGCDSIVTLNLTVNPSPITPINLSLDNISNYFELTWQGDGDSYVIYRDIDSIAFVNDTVFRDTNVVEGTNYCYKVKAIKGSCESEQSIDYCMVFLSIDNIENSELKAKLYPNPANGKTILEIEGLINDANVIIYDINGREIINYKLNKGQKELEIDVKGFATGIYSVRVINNDFNITRKLIVK